MDRSMKRGSALAALLFGASMPAGATDPRYREAVLFSVSDETSVEGYEPQRFQTRLLGLLANGNHYISEYPALVVPLESGFVNVLVQRTCNTDGEPDDEHSLNCSDSIRVAPITGPLLVENRNGVQSEHLDPCGYDYTTILFASPEFVASYGRAGAEEPCNFRGWNWAERWDVHRIKRTVVGIDLTAARFSDVFGEPGRTAYAAAAAAALNHTVAAEEPTPQDTDCAASPEKDTGWTVRRVRSAWVARLVQQEGPLCQPEADLALPVDSRVTGYEEEKLEWDEVTRAVPDAKEAFASPFGGLVLVASASRIEVFDRRGSKWRPLGSWLRAPIVSVQWARGAGADRWIQFFRGPHP